MDLNFGRASVGTQCTKWCRFYQLACDNWKVGNSRNASTTGNCNGQCIIFLI